MGNRIIGFSRLEIYAITKLPNSPIPQLLGASGVSCLPDENLPFAWDRRVARVTLIGSVLVFKGDGEPERREVPCVQTQEHGVVRGSIGERRHEPDGRQGND